MRSFESLVENFLTIHRCTVFHWKDYEFSDSGDFKDKYWLTLNCEVNDFPINVVLPTSQHDNHHYSNPINLKDCVIIAKGESEHFNAEKTILDLKNVFREDEDRIKDGYEDGFLIEKGPLEDEICQRLELAIKDAETLDDYLIDELLCSN